MPVRFSYFDVFQEVQEKYKELRNSLSIKQTEDTIKETYKDYFYDRYDAPIAHIALAKSEMRRKELTLRAGVWAENAIVAIENDSANYCIAPNEIMKLKKDLTNINYRCDIEKHDIRPKQKRNKVFCCDWKIGDIYAFQLSGDYAQAAGLNGKYCLARKVDNSTLFLNGSNKTYPVVLLSIWSEERLPKTIEELRNIGYLRNGFVGRFDSVGIEYRCLIHIPSKKKKDDYGFIYLGNFPDLGIPVDDVDLNIYESVFNVDLAELENTVCDMYSKFNIIYPAMK